MNTLEFAIRIEYEGRDFYLKQAELSEDEGLKAVFLSLANEEEHHAKILESKLNGLPYEIKVSTALTKAEKIFNDGEFIKSETFDIPRQRDVYESALRKEQESIDLYKEMKNEAKDPKEKEIFELLIKQETEHYNVFEGLIELLTKAEDWVESAEFGNREDY
ncbi:MAG: ferritin family protein [Clostridia bacterium]|jgi:rubrerythrin